MKFEDMILEINSREKDELGCIRISPKEFLEMKKRDYQRPDDINMYIVQLDYKKESK